MIFAISRLIVFLAVLFSVKFIPPNRLFGAPDADPSIWHHLLRWDSVWYLAVMRGGYHYVPNPWVHQTVAFFPLYPVLSLCVARIFQCQLSTAALLVSNAASIAAVLLLYQYIDEHYGSQIAFGAVALLSFFPASMFFSAGYTESLAMTMTMAAFLDLGRARYIRAAFWCGLLTATRPTGIVMVLPLAYSVWPHAWTRAAAIRFLFLLGISCWGLSAFALYLGFEFNAPLAFAISQNHWYPGAHWSFSGVLHSFATFADLFRGMPMPSAWDPWALVGFAAVIFAMRSQLSIPELLFAATFAVLAGSLVWQGHAFGSMSRYMLIVFPAYIATAKLLENRRWLLSALCLWMAIGLFWTAALFAQWHWVG